MFEIRKRVKHKTKEVLVYRKSNDGTLAIRFSNLKVGMTNYKYNKLKKDLLASNCLFKNNNRYFLPVDKIAVNLKKSSVENYLSDVRTTIGTAIKKNMIKNQNIIFKKYSEKGISGLVKNQNKKDTLRILELFKNNLYGSKKDYKETVFYRFENAVNLNVAMEQKDIDFVKNKIPKRLVKKKPKVNIIKDTNIEFENFKTDKNSLSFKTLEKNITKEMNKNGIKEEKVLNVEVVMLKKDKNKSKKKNLITRILQKITKGIINLIVTLKDVNEQRKVIIKGNDNKEL